MSPMWARGEGGGGGDGGGGGEGGKALETHVFDSFTDIGKSEEKCPTEVLLNRKTPGILTHRNTALPFLLSKHDKLTLAYRFIRIVVQDVSRGNVTGPDEHHRDQTDL